MKNNWFSKMLKKEKYQPETITDMYFKVHTHTFVLLHKTL
jgi:hypothetical protein